MVWVGERTRQLDAAHLEFVRGISNPLGVKISDKCTADELLKVRDGDYADVANTSTTAASIGLSGDSRHHRHADVMHRTATAVHVQRADGIHLA